MALRNWTAGPLQQTRRFSHERLIDSSHKLHEFRFAYVVAGMKLTNLLRKLLSSDWCSKQLGLYYKRAIQ
jgi:hypothetical protein